MKRILPIIFIIISFASFGQTIDTSNTRFQDNTNWLKTNGFYPKRAFLVPSYGLYGNDTTSKISGQVKRIGNDLWYSGGGYWHQVVDADRFLDSIAAIRNSADTVSKVTIYTNQSILSNKRFVNDAYFHTAPAFLSGFYFDKGPSASQTVVSNATSFLTDTMPVVSGVLASSVNGNRANVNGNISLDTTHFASKDTTAALNARLLTVDLDYVAKRGDSTGRDLISSGKIKANYLTNRYTPQWPLDIRIGAGRLFFDGKTLGLIDDTTNNGQNVNVGIPSTITGIRNSVHGWAAFFNGNGSDNVANGYNALARSLGSYNSAVGDVALANLKGNYNAGFGASAGYTSNSDYNSFFGAWAGKNFNGIKGTFIGYGTTVADTAITDISTALFGNSGGFLSIKGTQIGSFITAAGKNVADTGTAKLTFTSPLPMVDANSLTELVGRFRVESSDSIVMFQKPPFNTNGSYTSTIATSSFLTNVNAFGNGASVEKSNQTSIGDVNTTELKLAGSLRFDLATKPLISGIGYSYNAINGKFGLDTIMITPNLFKGFGYSDTKKIQLAVNLAALVNKPVYIGKNDERNSSDWMEDSAVLFPSNTHLIIENARLKLTNASRDNIFRSANSGLGITNPENNPLSNITIEGKGKAILEGADNPRSTGDNNKTLSLTGDLFASVSYGTDSGVVGQSQTGDWRNIGVLFAYTSGIKITGLTLKNLHAWAMSFERSSNIVVRDLVINNPEKRSYANYVKNTDGIDFRDGCHDFTVENIGGITGDDMIALTVIPGFTMPAGSLNSMHVSKLDYDSIIDDNRNFTLKNIKANSYHNLIRVLNVGSAKIYNGAISDIQDITVKDSLVRTPTGAGAVIVLGSNSPVYGGATPIGNLRNITINGVTCVNFPYAINVQGSIAESSISNVFKDSANANPAIYFHPSSLGARNLQTNNIFDASGTTDMNVVRSGATAIKSGLVRINSVLTITDSALKGLTYNANYASNFTARSLIDKNHMDSLLLLKRNISDTAASSTSTATRGRVQNMIDSLGGLTWKFGGNSTTPGDLSRIGTINARTLRFITNNLQRLSIDSLTGKVTINTTNATAQLSVGSTSGGLNTGILLEQLAENASATSSYTSIDFKVPTTGLTGQFFSTANNYSNAGFNLAPNSVGINATAPNGQLYLGAGGVNGYISLETGGSATTNERVRIVSNGDVLIGTTTDASTALLNVSSTTKGFLPPRMTTAQRNAISSPATGLTLYCTDCTATDASTGVMQTYNGSAWKNNW